MFVVKCLTVSMGTFSCQALCEEWAKKPVPEQDFGAFHRQISAAAYHQSGRLKYRVHMLQAVSRRKYISYLYL